MNVNNYLKRITVSPLSTRLVDELAFVYAFLLMMMSHIVAIPNLIASFLVLPTFVIVPYLFGKFLIKVVLSRMNSTFSKFVSSGNVTLFTFSWFFGSSSIATLYSIFTLVQLPFVVILLPFFVLTLIALNLLLDRVKHSYRTTRFIIRPKVVLSIFVITVATCVVVIIEKQFQPFPTSYDNLYFMLPYTVQGAIRAVETGYFTGGRWPDILFSALSYSLFNVEPLDFMWVVPFILHLIFSLGTFLLFFKISKRFDVAVVSSLIGLVINYTRFWPSQFMHLKSNIILYAFFPLVLCSIYEKISEDKQEHYPLNKTVKMLFLLGIILSSIFVALRLPNLVMVQTPELSLFIEFVLYPLLMLILPVAGIVVSRLFKDNYATLLILIFLYAIIFIFMHMDEALLFVFAMFVFVFFAKLPQSGVTRYIPFLIAIFSFIFISSQWTGLLTLYSQNSLSALWNPSLSTTTSTNISALKVTYFKSAYPEVICLFIALGASFALFSKQRTNLFIVSVLSTLLLCFFFPEQQTVRFFAQLSPFISFILAVAFVSIYECINRFCKTVKRLLLRYAFSLLVICMILITVLPVLYTPFNNFRYKYTVPATEGGFAASSIADYEYSASAWLRDNLPGTTVVISDYRTMLLLNSLGNKIWLAGRSMVVEEIETKLQLPVEKIKYDVFEANSSQEAYNNILLLPAFMHAQDKLYLDYLGVNSDNLTYVVALSSRTVKWIQQEGINDVRFAQYSEIPSQYVRLFIDSTYFELIYEDTTNYLYLFKVVT